MKRALVMLFIFLPALALAETARQTRQLELSAVGIDRLEITCGAGSFNLNSVAGLKTIRVAAQIEVEDFEGNALQDFIEKYVRLNLEKKKNKAFLRSEIKISSSKKREARIHLSIRVPPKVGVKITDTSGPIRIKNFWGNLEIDDDSGRIELETITGNVKLNDGSGSILIEDVKGKVELRDGSGFVEIYYVEGDVIITDASGDIKIRNIDGNITVTDDSGDIDIKEVSGNVFILRSGTGDLLVELVGGKVTIRE